jgi:predicted Zn-dependent peptidase
MNKFILFFSILINIVSYSLAFNFNIPVHYDTLKNGLRIIIVPDTTVAVVSCRLYYFVGSMYEGFGTSGLSHMYEHMMFKGTKKIGTSNYEKESKWINKIDSLDKILFNYKNRGISLNDSVCLSIKQKILEYTDKQREFMKKNELWKIYTENGATNLNGWTSDDMTAYIVTLPKNKIELFYWIESDRMQNIVFREFYYEKDVVLEERRMRYENRPLGRFYELLNAHFYVAHPYRLPTIGWKSDIENYTIQDLKAHVKKFYTPDNAVIVLVGNVAPQKAIKDIKRYFEHIPRAVNHKPEIVTREPETSAETRITVYDNTQPMIFILFKTPGYKHEDLYKLDVIESVLSGVSGRLYERLVKKEELCINAEAENALRLHNGYFEISASLKNDTDPIKVEKIIKEEITNLSQNPPQPWEMERIKNSIKTSFIFKLRNLEGLSDQLAYFERINSWKDLIEYPEKISSVKREDIPEIVKKYFDFNKATIGLLLQKKEHENK